jgi:hypothetical protein
MNRRIFYLFGLFAPFLFVFTAILGGALRPGYSHITDTVSELFSPGSPNRFLLTILHTTFAVFLTLFGVGLLRFVQDTGKFKTIGITASLDFILVGILNILTATIFPQDAWGSTPTFYGEMHIIISGVLSVLSILYMILFGVWFHRTRIATFFLSYSIATVTVVIPTAGWFMASFGSPIMGISERVAILVGFQWTVILAVIVLKND